MGTHDGSTSDSLSEAMHDFMDHVRQLEETARGFKAEMERNGWSPTSAEMAATNLLIELISCGMRGPT